MSPFRLNLLAAWGAIAFGLVGLAEAKPTLVKSPFGTMPDGASVELFTLTNSSGMEVRVITYGGIVTQIKVPDRKGKLADVVLGYDSMAGYLANPPHFGAVIGRYANRIGNAQFVLDGKTYRLAANNKGNTLHGGVNGFDKALWKAEPFSRPTEVGLVLSHTSPDGDEGFPGALSVQVTYALNDANQLSFDYSATTDQTTVLNLTHHEYFNLAGEGSGDVLGHRLIINADGYTPVSGTLVPIGNVAAVAGTPLDFRKLTPIGERIDADDPLIRIASGYDHNFVIHRQYSKLALAARVEEPKSGRVMEVRTTEPGLQFYTANHLDGIKGKGDHIYGKRSAFCLETQHFPDSPNQPAFPTTTLKPGDKFHSRTVYTFSAQ